MYKIIGGDQNAYGPVTGEQLRQWFKEGRVNGQTSILPDGADQWIPMAALPEFADLFGPAAAIGAAPIAPVEIALSTEAVLARDYDLDIGDCISRAWTLVKNNFWPIVGITTLIMIIIGGINQLLGLISKPATTEIFQNRHVTVPGVLIILAVSLLSAPVDALFTGGLFRYYLKLIRGQDASITDAFSGFEVAGQLVLLGLVRSLLIWLGIAFCILPGVYLSVAWAFALPLIVDRRMGFWDAMEFSRAVVTKHWFLVFAFLLVVSLVTMCGLIACCIGIFVTITIGWVALMYAYEDIFGRPSA